jgi:putative transposase
VHLIHRFANGEFLLEDPALKAYLRHLLLMYKKVFSIRIFAYCFLDSHFHLVVAFNSTRELSRFIHAVCFRLARRINEVLGRKGHAFMDRARTPVIQTGRRLIATMRYIDLNPVRAGIVKAAHLYDWSSFRFYAYGEKDELLDPAPDYLRLSKNPALQRKYYREMVTGLLDGGRARMPEMTSWYYIGERWWVEQRMVEAGFWRRKRASG